MCKSVPNLKPVAMSKEYRAARPIGMGSLNFEIHTSPSASETMKTVTNPQDRYERTQDENEAEKQFEIEESLMDNLTNFDGLTEIAMVDTEDLENYNLSPVKEITQAKVPYLSKMVGAELHYFNIEVMKLKSGDDRLEFLK